MDLKQVLFGPAGYPADARGKPERVFQILHEAGMTALEYAAVHGLRTSEEKAKLIGTLAKQYNITMSLHAAYYISIASKDPDIRERSRQRLIKALKFAPLMGVKRIVFHPGTHGGLSREEAHVVIRDSLRSVWEEAGHLGEGAFLAPEIAGKLSMYGSVEQIIELAFPLLKTEGMVVALKGREDRAQHECDRAGKDGDSVPASGPHRILTYRLPVLSEERSVILINKFTANRRGP